MCKSVRFIAVWIAGIVLASVAFFPPAQAAGYSSQSVAQAADAVLEWRKLKNGVSGSGLLFTQAYAQNAGNGCDWFAIAAGRYGIADDPAAYLENIEKYITQKYKTQDKLDAVKATEWHRIALAVLACGGDPTKIGSDQQGNPVNLIADGVYNRGITVPLAKQGINGYAWGLITLDSKNYQVPSGSCDTRESMILGLLEAQLADGGFALAGMKCDPDTTAAVLTALAPYTQRSKIYTYVQKSTKKQVSKTVGQVVEEALHALSGVQQSSGGFVTYGEETCESAAQVITALCTLGIDPQTDARFLKNGNSVVDALFSYQCTDGGFAHTVRGQSNSIASEQAFCALVSLYRLYNDFAKFYNYTDDIFMKEKSLQSAGPSGAGSAVSSAQQNSRPGSAFEQNAGEDESPALESSGGSSEQQKRNENTTSAQTGASEQSSGTQAQQPSSVKQESATVPNALGTNSAGTQNTQPTQALGEQGEENGIHPLVFIGIGIALIAGAAGFYATKGRYQKQAEEDGDFFESIRAEKQSQKEQAVKEPKAHEENQE